MESAVWLVPGEAERLPLAERTTLRLRQLIRDGVLRPGDRLPSEPELARRLGVSRPTVRSAIAELAAERLVERRRGVGTFLREAGPVLTHGLERLVGTGQSIAQLGMDPSSVDLAVRHVRADGALPERLDVPRGSRLVHLRRTRTADGRRILHCEEWVPEAVLPSPDALDDFGADDSLYARLDACGAVIATALSTVVPVKAGDVGRCLEIDADVPVLLLRQIHYGQAPTDRPVLYTENFYNSELIELHAIRRR